MRLRCAPACKAQTYFRSSLLSLRRQRAATTGNTSSLRRLRCALPHSFLIVCLMSVQHGVPAQTKAISTCSHRLPFIVPCSPSSPSPPVSSFYPLTRVLLHPCSLLFLCYPCLPCSPLLPLFSLFPFSPFSPLFYCFLFLPVPLVLLCSPCSKHFIMILFFSVLINILKFLVES